MPGAVTPDDTIRTINWPLILPVPAAGNAADFKRATQTAVAAFVARYRDYFTRHNARAGGIKTMLDPQPRVVFVPGLGCSASAAEEGSAIAADIAQAAIETIADAETIGRFESSLKPRCSTWNMVARTGKARPA